jgi:hypothetical protein
MKKNSFLNAIVIATLLFSSISNNMIAQDATKSKKKTTEKPVKEEKKSPVTATKAPSDPKASLRIPIPPSSPSPVMVKKGDDK